MDLKTLVIGSLGPILLAFALNPVTWGVVAALLYLLFIRGHSVQSKVDGAIRWAYYIVEDMKKQGTLPAGLSKEAVALEKLKSILDNQNVKWTDELGELASLAWSAMHGSATTGSPTVTVTRPPVG